MKILKSPLWLCMSFQHLSLVPLFTQSWVVCCFSFQLLFLLLFYWYIKSFKKRLSIVNLFPFTDLSFWKPDVSPEWHLHGIYTSYQQYSTAPVAGENSRVTRSIPATDSTFRKKIKETLIFHEFFWNCTETLLEYQGRHPWQHNICRLES